MDTKKWMSSLSGDLTLKEICIPGSHDAGMYATTQEWAPGLALTQNKSILGQLEMGIRYFDLRPQYWSSNQGNERFYAYHGLATGPLFIDILNDLKTFFDRKSDETVILGIGNFKDFTPEVKKDFLGLIKDNLSHFLYTSKESDTSVITNLKLSALRGKIIILLDMDYNEYDELIAKNNWSKYFYKSKFNQNIFDNYSNTKYYETMLVKQFKDFGLFNDKDDRLFLLNWTLTPDDGTWGTVKTITQSYTNVKDYAAEINPKLLNYGQARDFLFHPNAYGRIVNIINGDFWDNSGEDVVKACLEIMKNRQSKQKFVKIISKGTDKALDMASMDTVYLHDSIHNNAHQLWIKKHRRDNVYRLQNAATGLYLRAATESFVSGIATFFKIKNKNNNTYGAIEENDDQDQDWHLEHIGGNEYHIVSARRKKDGEKADRLDGSGNSIYLHDPNDGNFQKWKIIE